MLLVHNLVYVAVVEIAITNSMNAHQVLDNSISHRECALYLLRTVLIIGHFKGVLTLSSQCFSYFWCIFVKHTVSLVFPVEIAQIVRNFALTIVIHVSGDQVCLMYVKLVSF